MSTPTTPQHPTMVDLLVALARLESKVDALISQREDHETRMRALEQRPTLDVSGLKMPIIGILSLIGAAGTAAATYFGGG